MASTRLGATRTSVAGRGGPSPTMVATTRPATTNSAATSGRPRPTCVAMRMPSTDAGRSISTATVPCAMSLPTSSMCLAFTDTIAASDVMMYQVSATAL